MSKTEMVVFDMDGTLTISKSKIDSEMVELLKILMENIKVAIISGGDYPQFQKQVLLYLKEAGAKLENIFICPTCATKLYRYDSTNQDWEKVYSEDLTAEEKEKIRNAFEKAVAETGLTSEKTYGDKIEDRGTQFTLSALGQDAPFEEKSTWDPDQAKRKILKAVLDKLIPEFSVKIGGTTSIDITKAGIDKAYGIHKLEETTGVKKENMIFVGDALFEGGNDYPVVSTGVKCIQVKDHEETKVVLQKLIDSGFLMEFMEGI